MDVSLLSSSWDAVAVSALASFLSLDGMVMSTVKMLDHWSCFSLFVPRAESREGSLGSHVGPMIGPPTAHPTAAPTNFLLLPLSLLSPLPSPSPLSSSDHTNHITHQATYSNHDINCVKITQMPRCRHRSEPPTSGSSDISHPRR